MSEEEKKAIENTEQILKEWQKIVDIEDDMERDIEMNCYSEEMPFFEMKTLLKLVKKQQKEIKELKDIEADYIRRRKTFNAVLLKQGYISKDKIREKIKEIQNYTFMNEEEIRQQDYAIERLKELFEEE